MCQSPLYYFSAAQSHLTFPLFSKSHNWDPRHWTTGIYPLLRMVMSQCVPIRI